MEYLLIVNADDFGLSKGQNYGIVEACRHGVVTSITAMVNGEAIEHAAALSRDLPDLGVGMHFVLTLGMPLTAMPGLTREGVLGKWIWERAEEGTLPWRRSPANWTVSSIASSISSGANRPISTAIITCI